MSVEVVGMDAKALQAEVLRLQKRLAVLTAFLRLLFVLLRVSGFSLKNTRLPDGVRKQRLLRAIDQSCSVLPLRSVLRVLRLSHTRYHWWRREGECGLDDVRSCPHTSPQQLTPAEIEAIKEWSHPTSTGTFQRERSRCWLSDLAEYSPRRRLGTDSSADTSGVALDDVFIRPSPKSGSVHRGPTKSGIST